MAAASLLQCLEVVGMNAAHLATMRKWAETRSVTLRLAAHEDCGFLREESRQVESPYQRVTEVSGLPDGKVKVTDKIVTTVKEYFWGFDFEYEIQAFQGTATDQALTLLARKGSVTIKTVAKTTPRPRTVVRPHVDVNVTWLFAHLDPEGRSSFAIDRTREDCHTPRRNRDVEAALQAVEEVYAFGERVIGYFFQDLFPAQEDHGRDLAAIDVDDVFVPVLPLFDENASAEGVLPGAYAGAFLEEERRSLAEKCRALASAFPRDGTVITAVEAGLLLTVRHMGEVCRAYAGAVGYIEGMLRSQLVAAIGKEVTPADFTAYMEFHHRKLMAPPYRPRPFSYAIRRPGHDPEGVIAIESASGGAAGDAISTTVAASVAARPMTFPLDASTRVSFGGERYLHAWVSHQFSGQAGPSLTLVARARQFSSYLLLVGRIASAEVFEPRFGIIVQNKDLVKIPLLLEQIPTPKEFRDAIASLSPEQQRFARAFRGMQLESTLFGVCVIQIKPQLEKLLQLPPDSLTKEIRMTQDLLSLFIEYQIPSDLLSYDGPADAPTEEKLARVRTYVGKMQEMIALSKQREIDEEREREALRRAEKDRSFEVSDEEGGGAGCRRPGRRRSEPRAWCTIPRWRAGPRRLRPRRSRRPLQCRWCGGLPWPRQRPLLRRPPQRPLLRRPPPRLPRPAIPRATLARRRPRPAPPTAAKGSTTRASPPRWIEASRRSTRTARCGRPSSTRARCGPAPRPGGSSGRPPPRPSSPRSRRKRRTRRSTSWMR